MKDIPTGNVTFLFTDIEGSTKLSQEFPETYPDVLKRHDSILHDAVESGNGFVFKTAGDAFCCAFQNADDAVIAAAHAQLKLNSEKPGNTVIKVRMGIHSGMCEWNGHDYMGYITLARTARIMSSGYGGQIIISNDTFKLLPETFKNNQPDKDPKNLKSQSYLSEDLNSLSLRNSDEISFRDLGERRLKDVTQPIRLFQIICPGLCEDFPPLKTLDARPNNLPVQLTSFIGREAEIKRVKDLLYQTRLLTITGSGGAGKSRLSLQVAADVIDDFPNGVWFIELAALTDSLLLLQTIIKELGLKEEAKKSPEETLCDYLKDKDMLIILDNCEHLIESCAKLAEKLLSNSPKLKILATSRESLRCKGEQTHILQSLEVPDPKTEYSGENLSEFESVRLFIERALAVNSAFRVSKENATALAQICCQLDGIPLAIELAAARVKILPVEKINERLNDRFRLLTGGKRTALPRQQTLKALIDWSYDLLNQEEKILWERLSVFTGGWTLDAAEEVCSDEKINKDEILDLLSRLIEKSIITYDEVTDRYKVLGTIKEYGEEKLKQSEESSEIFSKYLDYFTMLSESAKLKIEQNDGPAWLEKIENDHVNFQSAIELSMKDSQKEKGARIAIALKRFWIIRGHYSTGRQLLKNILKIQEGLSKSLIGMIYSSIGSLSILQVGYAEAESFFDKGLALQREINDKPGIAYSLNGLGYVSLYTGKYEDAQKYFLESLELYRETGSKSNVAKILNNLGNIEIAGGKQEEAKKFYEESLNIFRESGNKTVSSLPLNNLGAIANNQGNYELAKEYFQESLIIAREKENKSGIASTLFNLGMAECSLGNNAEALALLEECRTLYREIGDKSGISLSLYGFGIAASSVDNYEQADNYFKECLALKQEIGEKIDVAECMNYVGAFSFIMGNLEIAQKNVEMSLDVSCELKNSEDIAVSLVVFSGILNAHNKLFEAAKLLGAAERGLQSKGKVLDSIFEKFEKKIIEELRKRSGDAEFDKYFEDGKKLTLEEAVDLALSQSLGREFESPG